MEVLLNVNCSLHDREPDEVRNVSLFLYTPRGDWNVPEWERRGVSLEIWEFPRGYILSEDFFGEEQIGQKNMSYTQRGTYYWVKKGKEKEIDEFWKKLIESYEEEAKEEEEGERGWEIVEVEIQ